VLGVLVALATSLFSGAWRSPANRWVGLGGDPVLFAWFIRWGLYAVTHGHGPFLTHHLNYPAGVNLMWNTAVPLASLVTAPVTARFGAVAAYNLLTTAGVALAGWCAYLTISRYVVRRLAAFVGALVYGFSPFVLAQGLGHLHLVLAALGPPLLFLILDGILVRQRVRPLTAGALLGVLVAAEVLTAEEVAASSLLVAALAAAALVTLFPGEARGRTGHAARALAVTAAVAAALLAWPLAVQFGGPQRVNTHPLQPQDVYVSDALGFVVPTSLQQLAPRSLRSGASDHFTTQGSERTAYLGIPLLFVSALAAVRLWRRPVVKVAAVLAIAVCVLSLGPHLHLRGHVTGVPLPWDAVQSVPLIRDILPNRLMLYVDLLAGLLFALFVDVVMAASRRVRLGGGLAVAAVIASLFPRLPYPSAGGAVPIFFRHQARQLPDDTVALVAPWVVPSSDVGAMRWQLEAGMRFRMPEGYFIGPDRAGRPMFGPLPTATAAAMVAIERGAGPQEVPDTLRRAVLADLVHWRVTTVIVGPMPNADATVRFFEQVLGRPPSEVGQVRWWPDVTGAS